MDVVGGTRTQLKVFKNDEDASVDSVDATFSLFASLFKSALQVIMQKLVSELHALLAFVYHFDYLWSYFRSGSSWKPSMDVVVSAIIKFVIDRLFVKEGSFRPRRQLIVKQRWFQSIHKHTYMKSLKENVTAFAIPLALAIHACSHCHEVQMWHSSNCLEGRNIVIN
ncbi:uncharacterized protein LOC118485617 [Helianthus annuus]|uniref:uncharacterized protein LOC118485617 n=1 Tax=Helianthus annuus TaxID=4232 RepID=UPI0016533F4C|nr:uncharacterized protein LOC118485617 [Helianthus annuus]XP_035837828.1 uncharacterized protein LOC118485617 [Helianthus annuus]XP_035837829.1 uncharacterized protein LOC118485617 [Helianthus annuus]